MITSPKYYFRLILLIFGCLLCGDSLYLLMLGKIHIGILLPFIIGSIFLFISIRWHAVQLFLAHHRTLKKIYNLLWALFILWLISFAYFAYQLQTHIQNQTTIPAVKAIIVLGSGTIQGKPSPTLALRLDRAASIAQQQPQAWIVLSGGLDFSAKLTEAEIMATYLHNQYHLSPERMLLENQSTSTELNLKNSAVLLQQHQINKNVPIAIVTSDFHTIRAKAIAQKQQYTHPIMFAAPTPLQTRYQAWLREYFAFISGKILQEY